DKNFPAHVTEVGDTAILRSTGAAASSNGSDAQQAKDFKVVVQLDNPPSDIRPGLSCTAQITTATAPPALPTAASGHKETPIQGIFVIKASSQTAEFVPAATGITGVDHIQVLSGVKPGDQVVTGPYAALRDLANHAKIKVDNSLSAQAAAAASNPSSN